MEYTANKANRGSLSFGLSFRQAKCPAREVKEISRELEDREKGFIMPEKRADPCGAGQSFLSFLPADGERAPEMEKTGIKSPEWQLKAEENTVPFCPEEEISDRVLYLKDKTPSKKLYIPRYRLAEQHLAGHSQYRVVMKKDGQGWNLEVRLEKYPAPELPAPVWQLEELDHEVSIALRYRDRVSATGYELIPFNELIRTASDLKAVLNIRNLAERDRLYHLFTDPACGSELVVSRTVEVTVPLQHKRFASFYRDPSGIRKVRCSLENPVPFYFPPELHGYIFRDLKEDSGTGVLCRMVEGHAYYQDPEEPRIFYYIPDSFKLARRSSPPYIPLISVRLIGDEEISLEYTARPRVNPKRLKKALRKLSAFVPPVPAGLPQEENRVKLRPLLAEPGKLRLYLALPDIGGTGPLKERKGAYVDLRAGVRDRLILSVREFREVFEALYRPESSLFQGRVDVELGKGQKAAIPLIARLEDMAGRLLEYKEKENSSGSREISLMNRIESPLRIRGLTVNLLRKQEKIDSELGDLSLPAVLGPGQKLRFFVRPRDPGDGNEAFSVRIGLEQVEVLPDPEAVWNSIVDPRLPPEPRTLCVKTFLFEDEEAAAGISELIVEFEGGNSVELSRKCSSSTVTLDVPLKDRVLCRTDCGEYRYTVKTVDMNGQISGILEKNGTEDLLIVEAA